MDHRFIQNLRYKLQKRFRKLHSTGYQSFHWALKRTWSFLHDNLLFEGILEHLSAACATAASDADTILSGSLLHGENEIEEAAIAYNIVKRCVQNEKADSEYMLAHTLFRGTKKHDDALANFYEFFLEPLYEYIDEQLDDQKAILSLLRKYKQKCEWFQREYLLKRYGTESQHRRGEKTLALHLYEFLHAQGMEFSIEPSSVSGEADLIASQNSEDPVVADVKVFDPDSSKGLSYLVAGFNQVYQYTLDYNEPFGYMIIFKTCEAGLAISLESTGEKTVPFFVHNNKTIFFIVVDLFAHERPASQRGKLKTHTLESDMLMKVLDEGAKKSVEPN